jgi:hypothetical protein
LLSFRTRGNCPVTSGGAVPPAQLPNPNRETDVSGKKKTSITTDQPTLKIGSRVRCSDDGVEGRITRANGTSVKIAWADGEKVTWKRADLPDKGLEVLGDAADEPPVDQAATAPTPTEQPAAAAMPPVEPPTADPAPVEQVQPPTPDEAPVEQTPVEQVTTAAIPTELTSVAQVATAPVATEPAAAVATAPAKKPRTRQANAGDGKEKKLSALDAAAKVLGEAAQPLTCQEMIDAMAAKGYWTSPGGQTPAATLYSAILRELTTKGADARFVKTARGKFARKEAA